MHLDDVLKLYAAQQRRTTLVPLAEDGVPTPKWEKSLLQLVRYNGYPAMRISGAAAPGHSSGEAMARDRTPRGAICRRASAGVEPVSRCRSGLRAMRRWC